MSFDLRPFAIAVAAFCSFINLYSPQALLPELARVFGVSPGEISSIMMMGTLGVALSAPFAGAAADVIGRKRVITMAMAIAAAPAALIAAAPDVPTIVALRFVQGLLLPPIFTVAIAYIGDEFAPQQAAGVTGVYVMGASFGGISGRLLPGIVTDLAGWRAGFAVLAIITMAGAVIVAAALPREKNFVKSDGLRTSSRQMLSHLADPHLLGTFAIGFGVLFNFIATFTYIGFRLRGAPYSLSNTALGTILASYLIGSFITPLVGRGIAALGRRELMFGVLAIWCFGILLLLASPLLLIIAGLILCGTCGLLVQAVSTGYVTVMATAGRSSAVGLYVTAFYVGGSLGALLPGLTWADLGWPMVVGEVVAMLVIMAVIAALVWRSTPARR